ncbi:MAG: hypothetical protein QNL07_03125 [Candidatus Planktophila sp.]
MLGGINNGLFISSFGGFFAVAILALILKWAFARGKSVIERRPKIGSDDQYGTLVAVASPNTHIEGEILRQKLIAAKIKATLTQTSDGPRLFVFARDKNIALAILKS